MINEVTGEVIEDEESVAMIEIGKQEITNAFTDDILNLFYQQQAINERLEAFKYQLKEMCKKYGIIKIENEYFDVNYIMPSVAKIVDVEKLKEDGLLEQYQKESNRKDSIRIKIK